MPKQTTTPPSSSPNGWGIARKILFAVYVLFIGLLCMLALRGTGNTWYCPCCNMVQWLFLPGAQGVYFAAFFAASIFLAYKYDYFLKNWKYILAYVAIGVLILLIPVSMPGCQLDSSSCIAQIASVSVCYASDGTWKSDGCGIDGCLLSEYGMSAKCSTALAGYDWIKNETHFNCGPRPA